MKTEVESDGRPPGPSRTVTIRDIARRAGVSASTVSRVLSGSTPVARSTAAAVRSVVETLHYRPNLAAQRLALRRSRTIGVLCEQISNRFCSQILGGIEKGLRGTGYQPVFVSDDGPDGSAQAVDLLLSHPVDALVVVGGRTPGEQLARIAAQVPLVGIGREIPGFAERCICAGSVAGAYSATRHLIGLGHRRIVHIMGRPTHPDSLERLQGYEAALAESGIRIDPRLILEGDFEEESGLVAVDQLLRKRVAFTAVFAANDCMAWGAGLALMRRRRRVPQDVSLVGFDDGPAAAYSWPPLTTIRQPIAEMGRRAIRALVESLGGKPFRLPRVETQLVIRGTTAPPPPSH